MVFIKKKKHKTEAEKESEKQKESLEKAGIVDDFQTTGFKFLGFLRQHQAVSISLAACILLLLGTTYGWLYYTKTSNKDASNKYQKALVLLTDSKNPQEMRTARKAFRKIYDDHQSAAVGKLALLYVAHLSNELKDFQAASDNYQIYLSSTSSKDVFTPLALTGLANAQEALKKNAEALKTYERIAESKVEINVEEAYWQIARLAKKEGDAKKARQSALDLIQKFPNSPFVPSAKILLSTLPS